MAETYSSSSVFSRVFPEAFREAGQKKSKPGVVGLRRANQGSGVTEGAVHTKETARRTGCTLRQLQWWDESGLVKPQHWAHSRYYSPQQVETIRVIVTLRRAGIGIQRIRYLLKLAPFSRDESRFVLTDGKRAYGAADVPTVIRLMLESRKPLILIERHSLSNSSKTDGPKKKGAQG